MRKILAGLIIVGLVFLVSGIAFADVTPPEEELPVNGIPEVSLPEMVEPISEIEIPEISIKAATVDVKTAIETQPVSIFAYIGIGVDYLKAIVARLLETGKPAVLFLPEIKSGVEITLLENFLIKNLDLVGGLILNGENISEDWEDKAYLGLEYQIFSEFSIGAYSSKEGFCFGLAFKI